MTEKTCIVIPCFNEARRFKTAEFLDFVDRISDIDLCFVNDGSTDGTGEKLEEVERRRPERIHGVVCPDNRGKAGAVREGFLRMLALEKYRWIAFADADLATPLGEMLRLIDVAQHDPEVLMVMGARFERMGADIRRKFYRHFTGRIFAGLVAVLFRLHAYDTQCGAKVFRADVVQDLFGCPFVSPWMFDVELLLRLRGLRGDCNRIVREVPLNVWLEQGHSKIRFSHVLKMPLQLGKMYFRYKNTVPGPR